MKHWKQFCRGYGAAARSREFLRSVNDLVEERLLQRPSIFQQFFRLPTYRTTLRTESISNMSSYLLHDKEEVGICPSNALDKVTKVRIEMHSGRDIGCLEVRGLEASVRPP